MNRRLSIQYMSSMLLATSLLPPAARAAATLKKSRAEWQKLLPASSYAVLFEEATERPRSSPLDSEKRAGTYVCAACFLPLFKIGRAHV